MPLDEAVAIIEPDWFNARHANDPWCALIVIGAEEALDSVLSISYRNRLHVVKKVIMSDTTCTRYSFQFIHNKMWIQLNELATNIKEYYNLKHFCKYCFVNM